SNTWLYHSLVIMQCIWFHVLCIVYSQRPDYRVLPQIAGQLPHINRHRTSARADVIEAGRAGLRRERPHNLAGEDEGLGLVREFFPRSEIGDPRRRAVRGRLTCDEPG